ncbi:hypothetical protein QYE76_059422 [Lolium multiflorum]|uniref:Uncharacterized protein n=1 Tax=Lolium multiflorum TaxID=4521 RepID=A0AAD8RX55_LOLMU|nr:hypothetical protein QYE76_059422 [Lolium multiflorum]
MARRMLAAWASCGSHSGVGSRRGEDWTERLDAPEEEEEEYMAAKEGFWGLENIAYDPVPVNDSFPNEQLAVIKGPLPPALSLNSFPCVEEALRVTDEFCDQYRALRREVEILQEENNRLRRMLEYYSIPITRPPPPLLDNNESLRVLVQNCQTEKLKLKEIFKNRRNGPSSSPPKE